MQEDIAGVDHCDRPFQGHGSQRPEVVLRVGDLPIVEQSLDLGGLMVPRALRIGVNVGSDRELDPGPDPASRLPRLC